MLVSKQKNWIKDVDKFLEANSENWVRFDGEDAREVFPEIYFSKPRVQKFKLKMDILGFEKDTIWIAIDGLNIFYKDYKLPLKNFRNFMVYFEEVRDEPEVKQPMTGVLQSRVTSVDHNPISPFKSIVNVHLDGSFGEFRAQGSLQLIGQSYINIGDLEKLQKIINGIMQVKLI